MNESVEPGGTGTLSATQSAWTEAVMRILGLGGSDPAAARAGEAAKAIPVNVVALGRARLTWLNARRTLFGEVGRIKAAIIAKAADDEDREAVVACADDIFEPLQIFDDELEGVLEALVEAEEGPKRTALKAEAVAIIRDYMGVLGTGFFSEVDGNPFAAASVQSTARTALGEIAKALRV